MSVENDGTAPGDWEEELLPDFELGDKKAATYEGLLLQDGEFQPEYWQHLCKFMVGGLDNLPNGHERDNFEPLYTRIVVEVERRTKRIFRRDLKKDVGREQLLRLLREKYENDTQFKNMVDDKSDEYGECGHKISGRDSNPGEPAGKEFGDVFMVNGDFSIKRYRGALKAALKDRRSIRGPDLLNTDESMKAHLRRLEDTLQHKLKHCYKCRVQEHLDDAEKLKEYKWLFSNHEDFRDMLEEKHKSISGVDGDSDNDGTSERGEGDSSGDTDSGTSGQSNVGDSRYHQLMDVGVITDGLNVNWKKFRGVVLAFAKDVEEIRGPEEYFDIDVVIEAFYKWGLWKFEDEWIRVLDGMVDADDLREQVERLYTANDDFNALVHKKYEYDPNELAGNLGPGDLASAAVLVDEGLLLTNDAFEQEAEQPEEHIDDPKQRARERAKQAEQEKEDEAEPEPEPEGEVSGSDDTRDDSRDGSGDSDSGSSDGGYECNGCDMVFDDSVELVDHLSNNPTHRKDYDGDDSDGDGGGAENGESNGSSNGSLSDFGSGGGGDTDTNDTPTRTRGTLDDYASGGGPPDSHSSNASDVADGSDETEPLDEVDDVGSTDDDDVESRISSGRIENLNEFIEVYGSDKDKKRVKRPKVVNQVIHGNAAKVPQFMAREYVDCVVTSPPYWQLRDYEGDIEDEWDGGEWEGQLGHEPTPDMFVNHLADIFDGVREVMKPEGSLWVNLADTYSGKSGGHYGNDDYDGESMGHDGNRPGLGVDGVLPQKCLAGVPQRFMLEMIDRGWILRNKIIWAKQVVFENNDAKGTTMPTAAKDRVIEKAAEPIYHFVKQKDYHYDLDPIRRPHKTQPGEGQHYSEDAKMTKTENHGDADVDLSRNFDEKEFYSEGGANLPRVWHVNLQQSSDEHYAAYPDTLVERPVKATCPEGGVVMDPFTGTGTTLRVASDMGRNWVGIEFSDKYIEIARNNITKGIQQTIV